MMDTNTKQENIWRSVFLIVPVIVSLNLSKFLTDDSLLQILYSGLLAMAGAGIGSAFYFMTKDRGKIARIAGISLLAAICFGTLILINPKVSDEELVQQEWEVIELGNLDIESPYALNLVSDEVPQGMRSIYRGMKLYSDKQEGRIITAMDIDLIPDTFYLENAYAGALEQMLLNLKADTASLEAEMIEYEENLISAQFSYVVREKRVLGYGLMYMKDKKLSCVWLMSDWKSFSEAFIHKFDLGVYPKGYLEDI